MSVQAPPARPTSVYVHAPFCARRCLYCDFAVQVRRTGDVHEWLDAIAAEVAFVEREGVFSPADELTTLYVGGGTPSLLGPGAMSGLADVIGPERLRNPELEWTAEANPESLSEEVAAAWRTAGANRLSLGQQSFHGGALRWMGRLHGPDGARASVHRARSAGFDNLSVDLIFGLPTHLGRDWRRDLDGVLALEVEHVSLYGLSVEEATPLGRAVREGREAPVDDDRYRQEFLEAAEVLGEAGYVHYEVSNFARPGFESRHNQSYWSGEAYLGLGNGAHSYAPPVRRWNHRDWDLYRQSVVDAVGPEESREALDAEALRLEGVWLGLRTSRGLELTGLGGAATALVADWEEQGLARVRSGRVRLSAEGWLLLDRLSVDLDLVAAG